MKSFIHIIIILTFQPVEFTKYLYSPSHSQWMVRTNRSFYLLLFIINSFNNIPIASTYVRIFNGQMFLRIETTAIFICSLFLSTFFSTFTLFVWAHTNIWEFFPMTVKYIFFLCWAFQLYASWKRVFVHFFFFLIWNLGKRKFLVIFDFSS